jgi:hypothetical protein
MGIEKLNGSSRFRSACGALPLDLHAASGTNSANHWGKNMRLTQGIVVLLLSTAAASASGGISCSADDAAAKFELMAGVTRGMGGPVFSFQGDVEILDQTVAEDLRKLSFERSHLAQYWLDGEELRLLLYRERDGDKAHGFVELTIRTKVKGEADEGVYDGTYELQVFDTGDSSSAEGKTQSFPGTVSCFVE